MDSRKMFAILEDEAFMVEKIFADGVAEPKNKSKKS